MPTYKYLCKKCSHAFDRFQKISDRPVRKCPECGGRVERVISGGSGILFKGNGFYCTDYRSEEYKKEARKDSPETSGAEKGDSSSTDGKKEKSD